MTLDNALKEAAARIDERIPAGSKIAPLNFNSPHDKFSSYVLDEVTANLVDSRKLTVVDRREVDLIRGEFDFQFSGEVGDDSMQELGRMLGAQSIISGSLTDMGGFYRIVIRVLNVQNASVEVQYRANIIHDNIVAALLTGGKTEKVLATPRQTPSGGSGQATQARQTQVVPTPAVSVPSPPQAPSVVISNKRYEVVNNPMKWTDARLEAENRGGYLAVITSAEEQNKIENMLRANGNRKAYWIGGYRNANNRFVWITNEPMYYTNWATGEPNGSIGGQDKMSISFMFQKF
jgi:TolB-like protein